VFTNIIKSQIDHFPLYLLLGIITWTVLSRGTTFALNSIVGRSTILSQIYFPREIMAISPVITTAMMFCFELIAFGIFMVAFQFVPPVTILLFPLILVMLFFLVLGLSLPLSVLNVYYKDVQFIWGVIIHAGFFVVPIFYTVEVFPENIRTIIMLNPMAQIIDMSHDVVIYGIIPSINDVLYTIGIISVIFVIGYLIFRRLESRIVEEL
jgi:lipopolysaccharide transport system permease protein